MSPGSEVSIKYLTNDTLAKMAEDFLSQQNSLGKVPIPIEEIVEIKLGIRVVPIPELHRLHGFDSYLVLGEEPTIVIDHDRYEGMLERTRFTYAHELAHYLLHSDLYKAAKIKDEEDYIRFQNSLGKDSEKRLEIQAFVLASYLLVPQEDFRSFVDAFLKERNGNILPSDIGELIIALSDRYKVSGDCVYKHLQVEYRTLMEKFYFAI